MIVIKYRCVGYFGGLEVSSLLIESAGARSDIFCGNFYGNFLNFNVIKRYFFRILTLLSVKFGRLVVSSLIIKLAGVM